MLFPLCAAVLAAPLLAGLAPSPLAEYARRPDAAFAFTVGDTVETPAVTIRNLTLTSQVWQGITWTHGLQLFLPKNRPLTKTAVLWNQGGKPEPGAMLLGTLLAERIGAPVVFLYGVPNQPLFGGKKEDALIAETFVRYLETGDATWPLLFPMVKSVLAAMDATQAFAKRELKHEIADFVVTGASKRGWTSWLSAASGDPRVKAVVPMVIDTLNMPAQMPHQLKSFGRPSDMIRDYTQRSLVPIPKTGRADELWKMVDPYHYRDRLALPKFVINGANDPYWSLDALNLYWDGLTGEKSVLYVPNAGHNLQEKADAKGHTSRDRSVGALVAFCKSQVEGTAWPQLEWSFPAGEAAVAVKSSQPFESVEVWRAEAPTRDFRQATWKSAPGGVAGPEGKYAVEPAKARFTALFVNATYKRSGQTFQLSSGVRIVEPSAK